jgi:RNA polymerase sigma-70 factor, ECF subfamily
MNTKANAEFEAECIRRILDGEKHLFHQLIRPCERSIYFMLLSILGNETEAEDAAQETAIKVYRNLHLFRGESQFRTWVLSIAHNEGLGRLRKLGKRREESLEALTEDSGDFTPAILASWREVPAVMLERKEVRSLVREAIDGLPDLYRSVVLLRDIEEMDGRETAAALGITEGSVKVRLHRARALLQRTLAPKLKGLTIEKKRVMMGWWVR